MQYYLVTVCTIQFPSLAPGFLSFQNANSLEVLYEKKFGRVFSLLSFVLRSQGFRRTPNRPEGRWPIRVKFGRKSLLTLEALNAWNAIFQILLKGFKISRVFASRCYLFALLFFASSVCIDWSPGSDSTNCPSTLTSGVKETVGSTWKRKKGKKTID